MLAYLNDFNNAFPAIIKQIKYEIKYNKKLKNSYDLSLTILLENQINNRFSIDLFRNDLHYKTIYSNNINLSLDKQIEFFNSVLDKIRKNEEIALILSSFKTTMTGKTIMIDFEDLFLFNEINSIEIKMNKSYGSYFYSYAYTKDGLVAMPLNFKRMFDLLSNKRIREKINMSNKVFEFIYEEQLHIINFCGESHEYKILEEYIQLNKEKFSEAIKNVEFRNI